MGAITMWCVVVAHTGCIMQTYVDKTEAYKGLKYLKTRSLYKLTVRWINFHDLPEDEQRLAKVVKEHHLQEVQRQEQEVNKAKVYLANLVKELMQS